MATYNAPLTDIEFVIKNLINFEDIATLPAFADFEMDQDFVVSVLEEAGKFASGVIAPNRENGDRIGSQMVDGKVVLAPNYTENFKQMGEAGWYSISMPVEYGGQGLPELINTCANEMWTAADMAFSLWPLLSAGAALAIEAHASEELKNTYLPNMLNGVWSGTMNLTEPQSGSDLATIKTKAVPEGDAYRISGQKIYITYGDHEGTENVIHLVLARIEGAPEGTGGISLFIVPKFLVNADGTLGERNDLHCVSIEHKMGIHGSPTCVMQYGDNGGALGYLVGQENRGLMAMFTMMNEARLKVGLQGLGISEAAYQQALYYAKERVQGKSAEGGKAAIIKHPDVKRMLMTMKSLNEAARALAIVESIGIDIANHHTDKEVASKAQKRVDLMIPIIKAWITEIGQEVTSLGVQIHGGMGYIEETGAAPLYRDMRITAIYEGTNGIQAADLVGRKVGGDAGETMFSIIAEMEAIHAALAASDSLAAKKAHKIMGHAIGGLKFTTQTVLEKLKDAPQQALLASFPYLMQCGYVMGGWHMARSLLAAESLLAAGDNNPALQAKVHSARFYIEHVLPRAHGLANSVVNSDDDVLSMADEMF
jgi:alkylation response protein AidB-like acyl-CoA dehydrogenase